MPIHGYSTSRTALSICARAVARSTIPGDLLTKIAPVRADRRAKCPTVQKVPQAHYRR